MTNQEIIAAWAAARQTRSDLPPVLFPRASGAKVNLAPHGSLLSLMFHRCISLQSNFGFPGLIGGVLMSPGASPFRMAHGGTGGLLADGRNGNQRPADESPVPRRRRYN